MVTFALAFGAIGLFSLTFGDLVRMRSRSGRHRRVLSVPDYSRLASHRYSNRQRAQTEKMATEEP